MLLKEEARKLLQQAIENEIGEYLERYAHERDEHCRRLVVRNGHLSVRDIVTGIGLIPISQPRIDDRRLRKSKGTGIFDLSFIHHKENVIFLGPPGIGKTQPAVTT